MFRIPDWTRRRKSIGRNDPRDRASSSDHRADDSRVLSYSTLPPGQSGVAVEVTSERIRVVIPPLPFTLAEKWMTPAITALVFAAILPAAAMYFWRRDPVVIALIVLGVFLSVVSVMPPMFRSGRLTSAELIVTRDWVILHSRRFGFQRVRRWRASSVRDIRVREIELRNRMETQPSAGQLKLLRAWRPAIRLVTLDSYDDAEDVADHVRQLLGLPKPEGLATLISRPAWWRRKSTKLPNPDGV